MKKLIALAALAAFSAIAAEEAQKRRIYYVAANGSDDADGLTESTAWRTLEKIKASLPPGAEVRLRRGDVFFGPLKIRSGLSVKRPTVVTAFGKGAAPEISLYKVALPKPSSWKNIGEGLWEIDLYDESAVGGNPVKNGNVYQ